MPRSNGQENYTTGCPRCHSLKVVETFVDYESSSDPPWLLGWRCLIWEATYDPLICFHQTMGWESVSPRSHHTERGRRLRPHRQPASPHPVGAGGRADP